MCIRDRLVSLDFAWSGQPAALPVGVLWGASLLALTAYVARGCVLSGAGLRSIVDLLWAPVYVAWKVVRIIVGPKPTSTDWVRTTRTSEVPVSLRVPARALLADQPRGASLGTLTSIP